MTEEINILLTASDEASGVIADASEQIDGSLQDVEAQTEELETTTSQSMSSVAQSHEEASTSFKDTAMTMNTLALSGANLFMSYNQIENAEKLVKERGINAKLFKMNVAKLDKNIFHDNT